MENLVAENAVIDERVILIRLADDIANTNELYERTRKKWHINLSRARKAEYIFSTYRGVVKEVYVPESWKIAEKNKPDEQDRYEFQGSIADNVIRDKYIGTSVKEYFGGWRSASPTIYVNIPK